MLRDVTENALDLLEHFLATLDDIFELLRLEPVLLFEHLEALHLQLLRALVAGE